MEEHENYVQPENGNNNDSEIIVKSGAKPQHQVLIVTVVVGLLVAVIAIGAYYIFVVGAEDIEKQIQEEVIITPPEDSFEVKANPDLSLNQAYLDGRTEYDFGDKAEAQRLFEQAAGEASSPDEEAQAEFMAALSIYDQGRLSESIQKFLDILENPKYENGNPAIKSSSVEWLVNVLLAEPTPENIDLVFNENSMFADLYADPDAFPSQLDVSVYNLYKFAYDNYHPSAELDVKVANSLLNNNIDVLRELSSQCVTPENKPIYFCSPNDVDESVFTEDQLRRMEEVRTEVSATLERLEYEIDELRDAEAYTVVARVLTKKARIMLKSLYFGVSTYATTESAMIEAISFYESRGNVEGEFTSRIDYAIFLRGLHPDPTPDEIQLIVDVVHPIYTDTKFEDAIYFDRLKEAYESEKREHSVIIGMMIRSNANVATVVPEYKAFLETNAGWDFNDPAITNLLFEEQPVGD